MNSGPCPTKSLTENCARRSFQGNMYSGLKLFVVQLKSHKPFVCISGLEISFYTLSIKTSLCVLQGILYGFMKFQQNIDAFQHK